LEALKQVNHARGTDMMGFVKERQR
jgi:hypothetical protein